MLGVAFKLKPLAMPLAALQNMLCCSCPLDYSLATVVHISLLTVLSRDVEVPVCRVWAMEYISFCNVICQGLVRGVSHNSSIACPLDTKVSISTRRRWPAVCCCVSAHTCRSAMWSWCIPVSCVVAIYSVAPMRWRQWVLFFCALVVVELCAMNSTCVPHLSSGLPPCCFNSFATTSCCILLSLYVVPFRSGVSLS